MKIPGLPFGFTQVKPHHYREMAGVLWENRTQLPYAWKILNHGVCDGCSLGPYGLKDNVIEGTHLCMTRLKLLRINTMGGTDDSWLYGPDALATLRSMRNEELQYLGRLTSPMMFRKGDRAFTKLSWAEALQLCATSLSSTPPDRTGYFVTSRGLTNEVYYVIQKFARVLGTNNVDLCSRLCHAASVSGLKETLGVAAPTCSLSDFIGTDLLIVFGSDLPNNQPVTTKYMHVAKQKGTKIIVVNPMKEFGLQRYWVPSVASSAVFGTNLMDDFFQVTVGGDIPFIHGVLKHLIAMNGVDDVFIHNHTSGFDALASLLASSSWESLERGSGLSREEMKRFATMYAGAKSAVFVYSMGLTQHEFGVDNVKAIVNLCLSRGMIGREKCGIMPIRGHSGVQGGGEIGCEADRFPGGFAVNKENANRFATLWGVPSIPSRPGYRVPHMVEAAHRGEIDTLYSIGGNLLETMPDRRFVREALSTVKVRIHQDIVLNTSTVLESADLVIVLPAQTRYEQRSGGTTTSTERRIRFTPEISGHQVGESMPEWEIPCLIARAIPRIAGLFPYPSTQAIRTEMASVMPMYHGVDTLEREGQWIQWGGPTLCAGGVFNTADGRGLFTNVPLPPIRIREDGQFYLATRRGKQFNSMIFSHTDALMATTRRDAIFISPEDATKVRLEEGDAIRVMSETGEFRGVVRLMPLKPGTLQMYWPEANVLISRRTDPVSGEPDYNTLVTLEKLRL